MIDKPFTGTKLVRNWVPRLEHDPKCVSFRVAEPDEMLSLLYAKMIEEMQEVMASRAEYSNLVNELADVYQVFRSLCHELQVDFETEVEPEYLSKLETRGSFTDRYVMTVKA